MNKLALRVEEENGKGADAGGKSTMGSNNDLLTDVCGV